jgi:FKBP-type peptidyl-prolyl cis-trans isomerase
MKKIIITVMACLLVSASIQAGKGKPKKVKMANQIDSVSYCIGVAVGNDLKKQLGVTMDNKYNAKLMIAGLTSSINGDTTAIPLLKADTIVENYMKAAFQKKEDKRIADNKNFLAENAKKPGVISLPSGLQYLVEKEGTGAKPADTSMVKVHYEGKLVDGTVFDSSIKRGEPITFQLNQVIKGWTEGVQLMPIGSKYKLFIPAELGYGMQKVGPIPPNSVLIFDVELLDIEKPKVPEVVVETPKPAEAPIQKPSSKAAGKTRK